MQVGPVRLDGTHLRLCLKCCWVSYLVPRSFALLPLADCALATCRLYLSIGVSAVPAVCCVSRAKPSLLTHEVAEKRRL